MKVAAHTLGCKVNQYDTHAMLDLFKEAGFEIVDFEDEADVYIVNTCTVTSFADKKSRQVIRQAGKRRGTVIVVAGCYPQKEKTVIPETEAALVVLGNEQRSRVVELAMRGLNEGGRIDASLPTSLEYDPITLKGVWEHTRANIKIQEGCNRFCSYCIIPYVRGSSRSRGILSIVEEVELLASLGCREYILTGICLSDYGVEDRISIADVVEEVAKIPGVDRIRLGSLDIDAITEDMLARLSRVKEFCPHFHISLQSGSTAVLQRMQRGYSSGEYLRTVELVRRYFKDAGITTDIIAGFPGESEEEFNETLQFVGEAGFCAVHVFPYSRREGTPAAVLPGQLTLAQKKERAAVLQQRADRQAEEYARSLIGTEQEVLLEEKQGSGMFGYTRSYIPAIAVGETLERGKIAVCTVENAKKDTLICRVTALY